MRRKLVRAALLTVAVALGLSWVIGEIAYPRANPPGRHTAPILSAGTEAILQRACFDCHSNVTKHPWYTHMPVANLVIGNHIREGREELNFSNWDSMSARARAKAFRESLELIQEGEMPVLGYTLLHPDALLSESDLATLRGDAAPLQSARSDGAGSRRERG